MSCALTYQDLQCLAVSEQHQSNLIARLIISHIVSGLLRFEVFWVICDLFLSWMWERNSSLDIGGKKFKFYNVSSSL